MAEGCYKRCLLSGAAFAKALRTECAIFVGPCAKAIRAPNARRAGSPLSGAFAKALHAPPLDSRLFCERHSHVQSQAVLVAGAPVVCAMVVCTLVIYPMVICSLLICPMVICSMVICPLLICHMVICSMVICPLLICHMVICSLLIYVSWARLLSHIPVLISPI